MGAFLGFTKEKQINRVVQIDVADIVPNPHQPRTEFENGDIFSLAESIRQNGILQPLTVRRADDHYEIIAGERRLRAAKLVQLQSVPCIIMNVSERNSSIYILKI